MSNEKKSNVVPIIRSIDKRACYKDKHSIATYINSTQPNTVHVQSIIDNILATYGEADGIAMIQEIISWKTMANERGA